MSFIRIVIADVQQNRDSSFWCAHIGKMGVKLSIAPDGLADISFGDPPTAVDGVDPKRFTELGEITTIAQLDRRIAWKRFFVTMEISGIILAFFALACALYWCLR